MYREERERIKCAIKGRLRKEEEEREIYSDFYG